MSDEIRELLKRVDEDALGTRCLTMAEVTLCLRELKRLTSERTYSHAEMLANQAAALREAAELANKMKQAAADNLAEAHDDDSAAQHDTAMEIEEAILALPSDQLALDRHDAELQAKGCKCVCHEYHEHMKLQDALEALKWHQDQIAELKAQTAAMVESLKKRLPENFVLPTPTDYAAALAERDKKIHYEGSCWMLDSIRASLQGYPDHGGDIEVMKEVDRIVREAVRTDRENLCSWLAGDPNWPEGKIVAENILTMTAEENALLAAHRAAAGAPESAVGTPEGQQAISFARHSKHTHPGSWLAKLRGRAH